MYDHADHRAAVLSALLPGSGQLFRQRIGAGLASFSVTVLLIGISLALGRVSGRAAEVFFFMLLALPWWAFQSYDAFLGPSLDPSNWLRTWRRVWAKGHDIRFLGLLLVVSAINDTWIILKNLDYLLPFYCTKLDGVPGFLTKAISPALHLGVGVGFMKLARWSLFLYLLYAGLRFHQRPGQSHLFRTGTYSKHLARRHRRLDPVRSLAKTDSAWEMNGLDAHRLFDSMLAHVLPVDSISTVSRQIIVPHGR